MFPAIWKLNKEKLAELAGELGLPAEDTAEELQGAIFSHLLRKEIGTMTEETMRAELGAMASRFDEHWTAALAELKADVIAELRELVTAPAAAPAPISPPTSAPPVPVAARQRTAREGVALITRTNTPSGHTGPGPVASPSTVEKGVAVFRSARAPERAAGGGSGAAPAEESVAVFRTARPPEGASAPKFSGRAGARSEAARSAHGLDELEAAAVASVESIKGLPREDVRRVDLLTQAASVLTGVRALRQALVEVAA